MTAAERFTKWNKENPEKARAAKEAYRSANRQKAREVAAKWRAENRERHLANCALWCSENKEKRRVDNARWRAENVETVRALRKKWARENPEKVKAGIKKWNEKNPERLRKSHLKWRSAHPERVAAIVARRRAKKRDATPPITEAEVAAIAEIYRQCRLVTKFTGVKYHVDHILAIANGGKHHPDNLQILPAIENMRKGARRTYVSPIKPADLLRDVATRTEDLAYCELKARGVVA